jgi:hypothetical protein
VLSNINARTRSGCIAAKSTATGPASTAAMIAARSEPAASSTASKSSVHASNVGIA